MIPLFASSRTVRRVSREFTLWKGADPTLKGCSRSRQVGPDYVYVRQIACLRCGEGAQRPGASH